MNPSPKLDVHSFGPPIHALALVQGSGVARSAALKRSEFAPGLHVGSRKGQGGSTGLDLVILPTPIIEMCVGSLVGILDQLEVYVAWGPLSSPDINMRYVY